MMYRILLFLVINFGALAIGSMATNDGVVSEWYTSLHKAPWTPPGWVFGFAWTLIMICFSFYMAYLWQIAKNKRVLLGLFMVQWLLNVSWNPIFFSLHQVVFGMIVIVLLTLVVGYFLFHYMAQMKEKSILVLPYFIWLIIASSLNGYILLMN